jgi:uncharacterized protein (TIGR02594 family)
MSDGKKGAAANGVAEKAEAPTSKLYVGRIPTPDEIAAMPAWMQLAYSFIGTHEMSGDEDNQNIVAWHATTRLKATDDETPWCSSFVNAMLLGAGYKPTYSAAAVSWTTWGNLRELTPASFGAVVVIKRRGKDGKVHYHVGFYAGRFGSDKVILLGGNQSDMVKESAFNEDDVVAVRWPAHALDAHA